jgi:hypothetical protein
MLAEDWFRDSYGEIGIQAAEQPITAPMTQTAIRYANRLMSSYDYLGLGYTEIDSASDEITIPPYAEDWAVLALACRLAPQNGEFIGLQELKIAAEAAYRNMQKHVTLDIEMLPPNGLPMGSGNQDILGTPVFYPGLPDDEELTEDGGYTILEGS